MSKFWKHKLLIFKDFDRFSSNLAQTLLCSSNYYWTHIRWLQESTITSLSVEISPKCFVFGAQRNTLGENYAPPFLPHVWHVCFSSSFCFVFINTSIFWLNTVGPVSLTMEEVSHLLLQVGLSNFLLHFSQIWYSWW